MLEKFAAHREGGLKGLLQARLPVTRKAKGVEPQARIGCPTTLTSPPVSGSLSVMACPP